MQSFWLWMQTGFNKKLEWALFVITKNLRKLNEMKVLKTYLPSQIEICWNAAKINEIFVIYIA